MQVSFLNKLRCGEERDTSEAESKEKHGVWDPMPELTIPSTLCPLQSRFQHIYHGQPYARVDLNSYARVDFIPPVRDFGFGLIESIEERSAKVINCIFHFEGRLEEGNYQKR